MKLQPLPQSQSQDLAQIQNNKNNKKKKNQIFDCFFPCFLNPLDDDSDYDSDSIYSKDAAGGGGDINYAPNAITSKDKTNQSTIKSGKRNGGDGGEREERNVVRVVVDGHPSIVTRCLL